VTLIRLEDLGDSDCLIFSSNAAGFHGAGTAGLAMRGDARNNWRQDDAFLDAIRAPVGSLKRVGKRAIFGVGRGLQKGSEGYGYAVVTVTRPGKRRSIPLAEIGRQLTELCNVARTHASLRFFMTPIGCGYAGYLESEMAELFASVLAESGQPDNLVFPFDLYGSPVPVRLT
jgi:hypothetical protein